jgi:hypothetical protein
MAGIYEKDLPSLQEYLSHFTLVGYQVGAVFMINGKVVGVDAFGKPETFSKTFKKLVESYAMDAIDWLEEGKEDKSSKSEVTRFTEGILGAEVSEKKLEGKTAQKTTQKTAQKTTRKIMGLIRHRPEITRQELAIELGITDSGIKYHLKKMLAKGLIRRVGPDKGGHWEVFQ